MLTKSKPQKQNASTIINLESYVRDSNLMITTPEEGGTFVGRAYEMSPLTGGGVEFGTLVKNMFKMAHDDALIQVVSLTFPDTEAPYLCVQGKTYGSPLVTELVHRKAKMLEEALAVDRLAGVPALNQKTIFITFETPVKKVTDAVLEECLATQEEFLTGLQSNGFGDARVLDAGELLGAYRKMFNPYSERADVELDEVLELRKQVFGPNDVIDPTPDDYVFTNGTFMGAIVPKKLPRFPSHGLMNLLIGAPLMSGKTAEGGGVRPKTPMVICATVRVAKQRKEQNRIKNAIKSRKRMVDLPVSLGVEDTAAVARDLQYIQTACSDASNKYVFAGLSVFVFGTSKREMKESLTLVKQTMNNLKFDARDVKDGSILPRFAQVLPLNFHPKIADELENEALMPASSAARLLPIFGDYLGNADLSSNHTGQALVTERGSVYFFDPFRSRANKNGVLSAKGGAGKSFFAQDMINTALAEGTRCLFFDNGRSLRKYAQGVKGDYVEFLRDDSEKPSLNPFTLLEDDEDFHFQHSLITALILKMAYYDTPMERGADIAVSESVAAAWGSKRTKASITTVVESLETIKVNGGSDRDVTEVTTAARNLIPRLKNFLESPARGAFFKGKASLDPAKLLTVYELSGLDGDEHLKQCVLFFVMNQVMNIVKHTPGRKLIMLDEAWQLLKDESEGGAAEIMEGLYRKARKDGGSIWVITQSPRDLKGSKTGDVILSQSVWKIVLEQESEEIDKIIAEKVMSKFADDPYFHKTIRDVKTMKGVFSGVLICGEDTYERARLYLDKFSGAMYSTESDERDYIFSAMDRGVDPVTAIEQMLGDDSRKRRAWLSTVVAQLRSEDLTDDEIKKDIEFVLNTKSEEALNA